MLSVTLIEFFHHTDSLTIKISSRFLAEYNGFFDKFFEEVGFFTKKLVSILLSQTDSNFIFKYVVFFKLDASRSGSLLKKW